MDSTDYIEMKGCEQLLQKIDIGVFLTEDENKMKIIREFLDKQHKMFKIKEQKQELNG